MTDKSLNKTETIQLIDTMVYAVRIKDREALMKSSSGGAFTAISDLFIADGDAVVCVLYNYDTYTAEFRLITTEAERDAARGSKYMQSKPLNIFKDALEWLKNNPQKKLLFVGMGCQAEGFRRFAEMFGIRERVFIADIICHGSSSPKIWREYAALLERRHKGKLTELSFRDKRNGWRKPTARASINSKEIFLDDYMEIFYSRCALRPSCHICPFACVDRKTDITVGDFWGIENKIPDFFDANGNSLFLIHTSRGKELFDLIKTQLYYKLSNKEDCLQPNLQRPTPVSENREQFWNDYKRKGIDNIMEKRAPSLKSRVRNKIVKIFMGGGTLSSNICLVCTYPYIGYVVCPEREAA